MSGGEAEGERFEEGRQCVFAEGARGVREWGDRCVEKGERGCSRVQVHRRGSAYGRVSCAYQSRVQSTSAGTQEEAKTGHSPRSAEASAIRGKTTPRRTREPARVWLRWVAGALSGGARKGGSTRLGAPGGRGRDSARATETERKRETGRERERERAREKEGGKEGQIDRRIEGERSQERRSSEHVSRG